MDALPAVEALKSKLREVDDVEKAAAVLDWDQSTYMPPEGAPARGRQLATLGRIAHGMWTTDALGASIDDALRATEALAPDHPHAALAREAKKRRDRKTRVPAELVSEMKSQYAASYVAWAKARPENDFAAVRPHLEKNLELSRRWSDCFDGWDHPADPHIAVNDEGMTAVSVRALFGSLREKLVPLVRAIGERPEPRSDFLRRGYPEASQLELGQEVIGHLGYDFSRGRQDLTHHPFMTKFSTGDVRITSRVRKEDFTDAFFSTVHEAGHALYEQGVDRGFEASPLANGVSAGVHESQSRLWENVVARSLPFWRWLYPTVRERFPEQLEDVTPDDLHRAVNVVRPSLIRVEADEVTYNLHVMLRFELASAMLEGELAVKDLPDAWNARYENDLGVRPPDDRNGVLQDVHWYCESMGGSFQGYTLGNVLSAQFWRAACTADPGIPDGIGEGDFAPLLAWLRDNVHRHGKLYTPAELVERATGKPLGIDDFVEYLNDKFGALYDL